MSSSRILRVLLPIVLVAAGIVIAARLVATKPQPPRRPTAVPKPLVETYTVTDATPTVRITGFGTVRAKRKISLIPQVSGNVVFKADYSHIDPESEAAENVFNLGVGYSF